MCENCEAREAEVKENFPLMMMLENAYNEIADLGLEAWGPALAGFADKVSGDNIAPMIGHLVNHQKMHPRAASEFFGAMMFKWGLAVGAACRNTLGDRFGTYEPVSREEADAEFERRRQQQDDDLPGVEATKEMIDGLRKLGIELPPEMVENGFRIVTGTELFGRDNDESERPETGKEDGAPGMYL